MKLIKFPEADTVYAADQPEYQPLPAYRVPSSEGRIICCWSLSVVERLTLLLTGKVWHQVLTFNQPLQPQLLQTNSPFKRVQRKDQ